MAARSLIALFRDVNPELLLRKDRGKVATLALRDGTAGPLEYGAHAAASDVAGMDLLAEYLKESKGQNGDDEDGDEEEDEDGEAGGESHDAQEDASEDDDEHGGSGGEDEVEESKGPEESNEEEEEEEEEEDAEDVEEESDREEIEEVEEEGDEAEEEGDEAEDSEEETPPSEATLREERLAKKRKLLGVLETATAKPIDSRGPTKADVVPPAAASEREDHNESRDASSLPASSRNERAVPQSAETVETSSTPSKPSLPLAATKVCFVEHF